MVTRRRLIALIPMVLFAAAIASAGPVWDLQVGMWWELDKHDSAVPPNEWVVRAEVLAQETIGPHDYFRIGDWNYDPGSYDEILVRCTEDAVYRYMGTGEHLTLKADAVGTEWTYAYPKWGDGVMHVEIISIEPVTVPYGHFPTAYVHERYFVPDVGDPEPPHIYNWFVPGYGVVREEDHYWETLHGPTVQELARMGIIPSAALDIEGISMCSQKDHLDGIAVSVPWRFEVDIHLGDPGTLHYITVTPPTGGMTSFTIYEDSGDWEYHSSPTLYSTLTALQAVYPTGLYTFDFRDISNVQLNYVELNYSDIDNPGSTVDFTYPWDDGQTGISTNPTLTWTVNSGAGHALGMSLKDETYWPVPMETLSWQPDPLDPEQNYWLYVSVIRVKDWAGGPGLPTKNVDGDEFEYGLHIGYANVIGFTTGLSPAIGVAMDILADTITLKNKWITCHIWPPTGYNVADIKPDSILLEGGIMAVRPSIRKKKQILVAKFPASDLNLQTGPRELFVRGELTDGTPFVGSDFVTVVTKGGKKN